MLGPNSMGFKITVLPGDGVGPEVCQEALRILRTLGHFYDCDFRFEEHAIGGAAILSHGSPLPQPTLDACLASDAVFLGAVGAPEFRSEERRVGKECRFRSGRET